MGKRFSRRDFLKTSGAIAAAACVGGQRLSAAANAAAEPKKHWFK